MAKIGLLGAVTVAGLKVGDLRGCVGARVLELCWDVAVFGTSVRAPARLDVELDGSGGGCGGVLWELDGPATGGVCARVAFADPVEVILRRSVYTAVSSGV